MWGDAEWVQRQREREEREAAMRAEQAGRGDALEDLLRRAEHDLDASRLVTLAQLIDPQAFHSREDMLENVQRMRSGRRGNDPDFQHAIATHERVARLSIGFAVTKAEQVLSLVRSWG